MALRSRHYFELALGVALIVAAGTWFALKSASWVEPSASKPSLTAKSESKKSSKVKFASFKKKGPSAPSAQVSASRYEHLASCRVTQVIDGDQFLCQVDNNKRLKIRLFGVAAPLDRQAYSAQAKQALSKLVYGKQVHFGQMFVDDYQRFASIVYLDNTNINLQMLLNGSVQVDTRYNTQKDYLRAEAYAKESATGQWNKEYWINNRPPVKPWEFAAVR